MFKNIKEKKIISPFKVNINGILYLNLSIIDLNIMYKIILIKNKQNETEIFINNINTNEQFFYARLKTNIINIYLVFINLTKQKINTNKLECLLFEFEIIQKLLKQW